MKFTVFYFKANSSGRTLELSLLFLVAQESTCQCRRFRFDPYVRKILWRRKRKPTLIFLPGKSHGQRTLAGYSLWGCKRVRRDSATKQQWQQQQHTLKRKSVSRGSRVTYFSLNDFPALEAEQSAGGGGLFLACVP